ncbi:MAG: sialate O-acetylesterase [Runella slithyformis]|nr:MAG: sialate O-acetylesterase [Runella sp.]TAG19462.1 MAG: sialate O-acetylesterase [Cytophagales bacterium]TAG38743.1 MAG: sialate O-acetylesterase [Cytophagia bacterium]TAG72788.1 MAG: sialate O-acetylesterase [Runella slithyformis]TAG80310.1 MAG: sialate O-acetylesterase [Cytophagales bacterium]
MKIRFLFSLLLLSFSGFAQVSLPALVSNNMVLQQKADVNIWGWANPGERVTVTGSWDNNAVSTFTNENGVWKLSIKTPTAGGPYSVAVEGSNKIVLQNILIGEVWLCAGQSNMEWSADLGVKDARAELPTAYNANIRFFDMAKHGTNAPQTDCKGTWTVCDSLTLKRFSAVGYFFGKKLNQSLQVPIGLIDVAWGGSYIESWIPQELVNLFADTRASAQGMIPSKGWPNQAGYIYNGMIAPTLNYNIAGAIWYQGESNRHYPSVYYQLSHLMVETWRGLWKKELPFYYVQIAPFNYGDNTQFKAAAVREMQTRAQDLPKSGMVVVSDLVDNLSDIHPAYKKEVGNRLAGWALAETYNQKTSPYKSPQYRELKVNGNIASIYFNYAEGGLVAKGGEPTEFEIAGADRVFYKAQAIIKADLVEVLSEKVNNPVAVRFSFRDAPVPNLFSKEGLPVVPFRTDNWELEAKTK